MQHLDKAEISAIVILCLLVALTFVEMGLSYWEDRHYYETRDTFTNIYLTSLAVLANLVVKGSTFIILSFTYKYRLFQIHNVWLYWFVLIVAQDFLYWLLHYIGHYCRFFWAIHVTH